MYKTPSHLPEEARSKIIETLNARLADGLDLHSQIKVAHWNIKGPQFASLHPLFETFAIELAAFTDEIAERAVTLGGLAHGTARHVAETSKISEYPKGVTRDLEHVKHLAERFGAFLVQVRASRDLVEGLKDADTVDLLTRIAQTFEKHAWFLEASLAT